MNKPSAIFKLNPGSTVSSSSTTIDQDAMIDDDDALQSEQFTINLGISIEPAASVEQSLQQEQPVKAFSTTNAISTQPGDTAALANKIVQHAYNFLSGFAASDGKVPMKAFDEWWRKFKSRLAANPKFLDNLD